MLQTARFHPTGTSDNATNQPQRAAPPGFDYPMSNDTNNQPQQAAPPGSSYPTSNDARDHPPWVTPSNSDTHHAQCREGPPAADPPDNTQRGYVGTPQPSQSNGHNVVQPPPPGNAHTVTNTADTPAKPRSRASALIATLNMKGRSSPDCGPGPLSKWTTVHRVLREKKISILCLQETHLDEAHVLHIKTLFG